MWCLNKTIGIRVLIQSLPIQITFLTKLIMPHISNIEYQISTNICARVFLCVSFDTFNSFSHSANPNKIQLVGITLAQVKFCTLAHNDSCSSKREHIPHKNKMYNNLLFIDEFLNNHQFSRCRLFFTHTVDSRAFWLSAPLILDNIKTDLCHHTSHALDFMGHQDMFLVCFESWGRSVHINTLPLFHRKNWNIDNKKTGIHIKTGQS